MVEIEEWIEKFNQYLARAIEQIRTDNYLKKVIAQFKVDMFDDNSHDWAPLKESTIKRKTYLAKKGEIDSENIEKINVRTGEMKSRLTNAARVRISSDFEISFQYDKQIAKKVDRAQELDRDPIEFTDEEFAIIVEYVADALSAKISERYGNGS